jgi:hypothetical protein
MKFRNNMTGTWYKGNTHLHTTASDGGNTYKELADLYENVGYDFIAYTDHWVSSDIHTLSFDTGLLLLDGIELDGFDHTGAYYHAVCLGKTTSINREDGFETALQKAREQEAMTVLAHPHWSGNSLEDSIRWDFDGVEVFNNVCYWLNGKGSGAVHWSEMLKHKTSTLAFAVDDAHLRPSHPAWNGGWIMVNSPELSTPAILSAIRQGNFYSSQDPLIHNLSFDGEMLHVESSPVRYVRLIGPAYRGQRIWAEDNQLLTSASLVVPADWDYVYLQIEDAEGRIAWTNTLFSA